MIAISVLGSTGSIGTSTLDVISQHLNQFRVCALSANTQVDLMLTQCIQFMPDYAVMVDDNAAEILTQKLKSYSDCSHIKVLSGKENLEMVASMPSCDYVMAAIVGAAGLPSSIAAAKAGKRILLANKESLVMSGSLFMQAVAENNAELLPVDSEHNAIFQSLPDNFDSSIDGKAHKQKYGIEKLILTASGGPFRNKAIADLSKVTVEEACAHPNWDMGRKISVDSSTMMNKGLEVIEASWLFSSSADKIEVVIHPQSIIHSMVSYCDGSVIAQLGNPDMRTPIAYALSWPKRINSNVKPLNLFDIAQLDFVKPDYERFQCLKLSFDALRAGGSATCILNAANEVAVAAFLDKKIPYLSIPKIVDYCLQKVASNDASSLELIYQTDIDTREVANQYLYDNYHTIGSQTTGSQTTNA